MPKRSVAIVVAAAALAACGPSMWVANVYKLDGTMYMQKCTSYGCSTEEVGTLPSEASSADLTPLAPLELEREMVSRTLVDVKPTIQLCGRIQKAFVSISVKVTPSGDVDHVIVRDTDDAQLAECVALAVRTAHFPRTQRGGGFRYPLVL